jgi:HTH-type transcriptional regulator, transcriptional repressor of NAD biosynthesis genes
MEHRFGTGLVVGKFCPLHLGHEHLIAHARRHCERLVVLSYTRPDFHRCDGDSRERWLRELFPDVQSLVLDDARLAAACAAHNLPLRRLPHNDDGEAVHREFCGWVCTQLLGAPVDAVFTSEDYGDGFADALTDWFSRHGEPRAVTHVSVDRARAAFPISGTTVREDPHGSRDWLSPAVYGDFVDRLCILGGESSGKTTLAALLARALDTTWAAEYGRELWMERKGELAFDDLLHIARTQRARENTLARQARRWLVCDTGPLTTLGYSHSMFGRADPELEALAGQAYAHVFLCRPDFPFVQDGTRRDESFRQRQYDWYVRELERRCIAYQELGGSLSARIADAMRALSA